ncbi:MAG TPA: ABC transporter permease subunit [Mobilitalea sp.]|nr:ABC transporter permease subunit [Mobilitalea sp.]
MNNILKSDFYRLFKSKSYYICAGVAVFLLVLNICLAKWLIVSTNQGDVANTILPYKDGISYGLTVFANSNILMIIAIFTAIYITAEFAHGTMKNAVSKGFSKLQIYLSKLTVMTVAAFLILFVTFLAGVISASIITGTVGDFTSKYIEYILKIIGIELLLNLALTSVLVMVAMVFRNLGGVIAIDILGVLSLGTLIFNILELIFDGKIKFTEYSLLNNISFYFQNQTATGSDYLRSTIVGIAFLVVFAALGTLIFKKADVK